MHSKTSSMTHNEIGRRLVNDWYLCKDDENTHSRANVSQFGKYFPNRGENCNSVDSQRNSMLDAPLIARLTELVSAAFRLDVKRRNLTARKDDVGSEATSVG